MSWIRIEPAIVYRAAGEGRRYLTRAAAYKHAAKALIEAKRKCTCEPDDGPCEFDFDGFGPWERCPLHQRPDLVARVARLMERDDERVGR